MKNKLTDRTAPEGSPECSASVVNLMAKTERLEFRTDLGFINLIQELADKDGVTRAEIVRRAIGLYAWAADEAEKGRVLTPTSPTSNPTKTHKTEETYLAVAVAERVEQGKERVFTLEESLADLGL
jgi:hypothetical protein